MVDPRTLHSREVLERLEEAFQERLYNTQIRRTVKFPDASVLANRSPYMRPPTRGLRLTGVLPVK